MNKHITIILALVVNTAISQEYVQTYYLSQPQSNNIGAVLVNVSELDSYKNPNFATFNGKLKKFYDGSEYPLLSAPAGSIFSMTDGIWGASLSEINEKRQAILPVQAAEHMNINVPILLDHPAPENIPVSGLMYRLEEDGIVKLFFVRQPDLLSTQLSAHDKDGKEITRTINLKTGEDITLNLRKMVSAKNFADLNSAETRKVNQKVKDRNKNK